MAIAITRQVSPRFQECELTHLERVSIDLELARAQHDKYIEVLRSLCGEVGILPAEPDLPDSVFVEDTAIILPELAVITHPGAVSRRAEVASIVEILRLIRTQSFIEPPATLDGGDVLVMGKKIYVGLSTRTNPLAVDQLKSFLEPHGYAINPAKFNHCLHLKTAVTRLDDKTLLINPNWVDSGLFDEYELIPVDPKEPHAANCLPLGGSVIFPSASPRTLDKLDDHGYKIISVDMSEFAKAEGGVTCCSLILG